MAAGGASHVAGSASGTPGGSELGKNIGGCAKALLSAEDERKKIERYIRITRATLIKEK